MANVAFVKTALTGGAATAVDGIAVAGITDEDICFAYVSGLLHLYKYDSSYAGAESSPYFILPDDVVGNGGWLLQGLRTNGINDDADSEVITIDSNENVGIGNTSLKSWASSFQAMQVGGNASFMSVKTPAAANTFHIVNNAYYDGDWRYISTDEATSYFQQGATHTFRAVASGTAGSTFSWTTVLDFGLTATMTHTTNVNGFSLQTTNAHATTPYGVLSYFSAASPDNNTQEFYRAQDSGSTIRFRVYSDGDVWTSDAGTLTSDTSAKENIVPASEKLADLMKVEVVNYNWNDKVPHSSETKNKKRIGLHTDNIEKIFPGIVSEHIAVEGRDEQKEVKSKRGTIIKKYKPAIKEVKVKGIKYGVFIPMLIKGMQEQQSQIEALTTKIEQLEKNRR